MSKKEQSDKLVKEIVELLKKGQCFHKWEEIDKKIDYRTNQPRVVSTEDDLKCIRILQQCVKCGELKVIEF